jgi:hypothetical protein
MPSACCFLLCRCWQEAGRVFLVLIIKAML